MIEPELLNYIWNGDRYPKLIRRIDGVECNEIAILSQELSQCVADKDDPSRKLKITYIKKRIILIDKLDLDNLERAVRQGLEVFYRVGEALIEICDRKLYKNIGYTNFNDYCQEKWNMISRKAYRLIQSAEVIKNVTSLSTVESVSHGTHFLPNSERITRELASLPPEQQAQAWKKAVETAPDHNPTAAHTRVVVAEIIKCPDKPLIDDFVVGQLVKIQSDRSDKRLVGYNLSVGLVIQVNPASMDIKIWGQEFTNVSPNDLKILDEPNLPAICISPSAEEYKNLLMNFDSKEEIIRAALK